MANSTHDDPIATLRQEHERLLNEELRLKIEQLQIPWWQKPKAMAAMFVSVMPVLLALATWIATQLEQREILKLREEAVADQETINEIRAQSFEVENQRIQLMRDQIGHEREMLTAEAHKAELLKQNEILQKTHKSIRDELRAAAVITNQKGRVIFSDDELSDELPHVTAVSFPANFDNRSLEAVSADLGKLPYLEDLYLAPPAITNEGFKYLKGVTGLQRLHLNTFRLSDTAGFQITDTGLAYLKDLPSLEELDLSYPSNFGQSGITDESLEIVGEMPSLRVLNLFGTRITDDGVKHLERLSILEHLDLRATGVTKGRVALFKLKLPNCKIAF